MAGLLFLKKQPVIFLLYVISSKKTVFPKEKSFGKTLVSAL